MVFVTLSRVPACGSIGFFGVSPSLKSTLEKDGISCISINYDILQTKQIVLKCFMFYRDKLYLMLYSLYCL